MQKSELARFFSIILGTKIWLPVLIILFILKTDLTSQQIRILFPSLAIFQGLLPLGVMFWLVKTKQISDWDIRDRKQRQKIMPFFLLSTLIAMLIVYFRGTSYFFNLYLIFWFVALVGVLVTYFWKISLHLMLNTTAVILVNLLFNWKTPYLYLLIPIIGWARYTNRHHNLLQIVAGGLLSGIITLSLLAYFGYIQLSLPF